MENSLDSDILLELVEDLNWCDQILNMDWKSNHLPAEEYVQHAIDMRNFLAVAAVDQKNDGLVRELCIDLFNLKECWKAASPGTQFSHASLIRFYSDYQTNEEKRKTEHGIPAKSNAIFDMAMPYVESLYLDAECRKRLGDIRLINLKGRVYSDAVASVRDHNKVKAYELMHTITGIIDAHPDIAFPRFALTLAVDTLIGDYADVVDPNELADIIKKYYCTPQQCRDSRSWLVGAVGIIGKIGTYLHPLDDDFWCEQLCRLRSEWDTECYRNSNIKYASYQAFQFLNAYVLNHRPFLRDSRFHEVVSNLVYLDNRYGLCALASTSLIEAIIESSPQSFIDRLFDIYIQPFTPEDTIQDPEQYAKGLCLIAHQHRHTDKIEAAWELMTTAPNDLQRHWFKQLTSLTYGNVSREILRCHIRGLLNVLSSCSRSTEDDFHIDLSQALVALTSMALALEDYECAEQVLQALEQTDHKETWIALIAVAAIGQGRINQPQLVTWSETLIDSAAQMHFTEQNAAPWLLACSTLMSELSPSQHPLSTRLLDLYEQIANSLHESEHQK